MSEAKKGVKQSQETVEKRRAACLRHHTYKLTSPKGEEHITNNLKEFCKIHKLVYDTVRRYNRKLRNGWKCVKV